LPTATNGVVVATEKKVSSPLVDETMVKKIAEIDKHLGMVYSGAIFSFPFLLLSCLQVWPVLGG